MIEPKCAMKPKAKKRRRRWWELNEVTKQYVEGMTEQFWNISKEMQSQILKLPKDFLCWHFNKKPPIEERHHRAMMTLFARPKGAFEYCMLEIDRLIRRRAGRVRYAE